MAQIGQIAQVARAEGLPFSVTIGAAFGCPFEGETSEDLVAQLAGKAERWASRRWRSPTPSA